MAQALFILLGIAVILLVLLDAFETVILPRRVTRKFRLTRFFYRLTWHPWVWMSSFAPAKRRENLLSFFGPVSLPALLIVWAMGLIVGFAILQWTLRSPLNVPGSDFATYLYMSGVTFFTLGFGDVVPTGTMGRALVVVESGMGFGFLAIVFGYLPVLYQSFSRREANIALLDARAGSPPSAGELIRRHVEDDAYDSLRELMHEWERWSAELMESHLSYPVLAFFRSQHDNQSWLSALTTILDASALIATNSEGLQQRQAKLTFAIARHAVVDLTQVFHVKPAKFDAEQRLPQADYDQLKRIVPTLGACAPGERDCLAEFTRMRSSYEPYVIALADYLRLQLPRWVPGGTKKWDNWQTSAWERANREAAKAAHADDDH